MSKYGWTDTQNCVPLIDGEYLVQTIYGKVTCMGFTPEGGWNTHRDWTGKISTESAINDGYVVRWYFAERPPAVPALRKKEYEERSD